MSQPRQAGHTRIDLHSLRLVQGLNRSPDFGVSKEPASAPANNRLILRKMKPVCRNHESALRRPDQPLRKQSVSKRFTVNVGDGELDGIVRLLAGKFDVPNLIRGASGGGKQIRRPAAAVRRDPCATV